MIIPKNLNNIPPAKVAKIVKIAGNLFDLPYTIGFIMYPSIKDKKQNKIRVLINSFVPITKAVIADKILTIIPPKQGIILAKEANIPKSKKSG